MSGLTLPAALGERLTIRTPGDAAELGVVLGVWAHPDDETYLSSGLMALARQAGRRVVCVTATRGEHGTDDPRRWPPERLARTRTHELAAALAMLGVDEHRWLDFEDGTLAGIDRALGTELVAGLIAEVQPDTVVSFGPDGMTGHPDHQAVAGWVHAAWRRSPSPPRLLQATTSAAFADEFAEWHATLGVFPRGLPVRAADHEIAVEVPLDEALADLKLAALRAQATQVQPVLDAIGPDGLRRWWQVERFREART
jgi:LmbE family N-acetylglucosaminyl deacetylase